MRQSLARVPQAFTSLSSLIDLLPSVALLRLVEVSNANSGARIAYLAKGKLSFVQL
jgi:hypothetical protein